MDKPASALGAGAGAFPGTATTQRRWVWGTVGALVVVVLLIVAFDPRFYSHLGILAMVVPSLFLGVVHYRHEARKSAELYRDTPRSE